MGWASGSLVMQDLIKAFEDTLGKCEIPENEIVEFWKKVISSFEDDDWDTQNECLEISPLWDKAYFSTHPYDDGYFNGKEGSVNPYPENTKEWKRWDEGHKDAMHEAE